MIDKSQLKDVLAEYKKAFPSQLDGIARECFAV